MTTDKVEKLIAEICETAYDWENIALSPEEVFVVRQALTHGPLSHNASTRSCLESALRKAKQ